jgi:hypothetical protein
LLPVLDATAFKDVTGQIEEAAASAEQFALSRQDRLSETVIDTAIKTAGRIAGYAFRTKGKGSIARKIGDELKTGEFRTPQAAANKLADLNRYTIVYGNLEYVSGIKASIDDLIQKGFKLRIKNYWERADYKGMNIAVTDPVTKREFELQFHTESYINVKEELHKLYEDYRTQPDLTKRYELWTKMTKLASKIEKPTDYQELIKIGDLKQEYFKDFAGNRRSGTSTFSKWMKARDTELVKPVPAEAFQPIQPIEIINEPIKPLEMAYSQRRNAEIENDIQGVLKVANLKPVDLIEQMTLYLGDDWSLPGESAGKKIVAYFENLHPELSGSDLHNAVLADLMRIRYSIKERLTEKSFKDKIESLNAKPNLKWKFDKAEKISTEEVMKAFKEGKVTIAIRRDDFPKILE